MKIEIEIDPNLDEPFIIIKTKENSPEIQNLVEKIQVSNTLNKIIALKDEKIYILDFKEIESIYSRQGKIFIRKDNEEYITKNRLYELEEMLQKNYKNFIRISNSEIINFDKVKNLDLNISGTIKINTYDGYTTYVSRRNIKKIKQYLKI